jgi:hypothetical protein
MQRTGGSFEFCYTAVHRGIFESSSGFFRILSSRGPETAREQDVGAHQCDGAVRRGLGTAAVVENAYDICYEKAESK